MTARATSRGWHLGTWGSLGWAETALKLAAAGVAIAALLVALGGSIDWAGPARGGQVGVLAALAIGLTFAIVDRVIEREIIAFAFILVNVAAHWAMVVAVEISTDIGALVVTFAALILAGDLVKLRFLAASGFTVRDLPRGLLFALTGIYAAGYVLILVLALF